MILERVADGKTYILATEIKSFHMDASDYIPLVS